MPLAWRSAVVCEKRVCDQVKYVYARRLCRRGGGRTEVIEEEIVHGRNSGMGARIHGLEIKLSGCPQDQTERAYVCARMSARKAQGGRGGSQLPGCTRAAG